jgi:hypothetical protein
VLGEELFRSMFFGNRSLLSNILEMNNRRQVFKLIQNLEFLNFSKCHDLALVVNDGRLNYCFGFDPGTYIQDPESWILDPG